MSSATKELTIAISEIHSKHAEAARVLTLEPGKHVENIRAVAEMFSDWPKWAVGDVESGLERLWAKMA